MGKEYNMDEEAEETGTDREQLVGALRQALHQAESPEWDEVSFEYGPTSLSFEFDEEGYWIV
jgi:hypothetical protein